MTSLRTAGAFAAYAALYIAVFGIALIAISDPECRFVGSGSQDYASDLTQPAHTGAPITFVGAPLLAIAALVMLRQANPRPRFARGSAIAVFPVAFLAVLYYVGKAAFACGTGLL